MKLNPITILGLVIAFIGGPLIIFIFNTLTPTGPLTNQLVMARELSIFALTGLLILLIVRGEKLGLDSIGIHNKHWGKSILWSLLLMVMSIALILGCLGIFSLVGISFGSGPEGHRYDGVSLWVITLMVTRAGIVEEVFYRGYIMERLHAISGKWVVYFFLPAVIFGLFHYRQGIGGIIISFVTGLLLAWSYWKKRDLKANIIAHFLVDFIPNVAVQWFA